MFPTTYATLVSYIVDKIEDLLYSANFIQDNTRRDLEWVQSELRMMNAILEQIAPKKIEDARITVWIEEVRKLAFDAEDAVDTFSYLGDHFGTPARKSRRINISQSNLKRDFGTEVTQLRERVDVLMKQRETNGINIPDTSSAAGTVDQMDAAAPYVEDRDVAGLDDHVTAVSYIDLPVHLRWCFLHLASIPEDCEALVNRLQRLWIGEGFIEEKDGLSFEEMAERCLEELVNRCLIQVVEKPFGNDFQRPERYRRFQRAERYIRVHDLLLELAVSEAEKIRFLDTWRCAPNASPGALIRRLSFTPDRIERSSTHLPLESNKLRTLLIMDQDAWRLGEIVKGPRIPYLGKVKWSSLKENLKLLRVLHLSVNIRGLLEGIGDLVNLRYLAISCNRRKKLPESVGNLRHLQTLDLEMARVKLLPNTICQIKTLRYFRGNGMHTELSDTMPNDSLPRDTFESLRALRNVRWSLSMEKIFPDLTNLEELELPIYTFHVSPVLLSSIKKMQRLRVLILNAMRNDFRDTFVFKMDETFLPSNSHPYLHTLMANSISVEASQLQSLPQGLDRVGLYVDKIDCNTIKLLGNLKHLHRLELADISSIEEREEMVFRSGWFPQLHVLQLCDLKIKKWEMEGQSLPLLRELNIKGCKSLEALPEGLWHISTLRVFELVHSYRRLHQRLKKPEGGCPAGEDWHKIEHIEYVHIS